MARIGWFGEKMPREVMFGENMRSACCAEATSWVFFVCLFHRVLREDVASFWGFSLFNRVFRFVCAGIRSRTELNLTNIRCVTLACFSRLKC